MRRIFARSCTLTSPFSLFLGPALFALGGCGAGGRAGAYGITDKADAEVPADASIATDATQPADSGMDGSGAAGATVQGIVVDAETKRPLANRTVRIGAQATVTDAGGNFAIAGVDAPYDLTIVEPDSSSISVY